jgi:hypothetical protein
MLVKCSSYLNVSNVIIVYFKDSVIRKCVKIFVQSEVYRNIILDLCIRRQKIKVTLFSVECLCSVSSVSIQECK